MKAFIKLATATVKKKEGIFALYHYIWCKVATKCYYGQHFLIAWFTNPVTIGFQYPKINKIVILSHILNKNHLKSFYFAARQFFIYLTRKWRMQAGLFDKAQPNLVWNSDGWETAKLGYNFIIPIYFLQIKIILWWYEK